MLITIVRHGETFMNSQRLLQGHSNSALSEIGEEQAISLGRAFEARNTKFTQSFSSDLQRAYNTAVLILSQLSSKSPEVIKDERLRERCFGDAEGRPSKELAERAAKANMNINDFVPPGAESNETVAKRAANFFDELCSKSESFPKDDNILVVSHGGWISALMRHLHNQNSVAYELQNFSPGNAIRIHGNTAVTELRVSPATSNKAGNPKYVVDFLRVNDTNHLKPNDEI